jgi:hypothetical protein
MRASAMDYWYYHCKTLIWPLSLLTTLLHRALLFLLVISKTTYHVLTTISLRGCCVAADSPGRTELLRWEYAQYGLNPASHLRRRQAKDLLNVSGMLAVLRILSGHLTRTFSQNTST